MPTVSFYEPFNIGALLELRNDENAELVDLVRMGLSYNYERRPNLKTALAIIKDIVAASKEADPEKKQASKQAAREKLIAAGFDLVKLKADEDKAARIYSTHNQDNEDRPVIPGAEKISEGEPEDEFHTASIATESDEGSHSPSASFKNK
jgi:hypothetical protein